MKHRFWEIVPGAAAWATLIILVLFSRYLPAFVVIFILFYDLYWLLRVVYFFFHLSFSFREMKARKASFPRTFGSQPKTKMTMALVDHE